MARMYSKSAIRAKLTAVGQDPTDRTAVVLARRLKQAIETAGLDGVTDDVDALKTALGVADTDLMTRALVLVKAESDVETI